MIRRTPVTDDVERLADRVQREGRGRIKDYDSFIMVWESYMEGEDLNDEQSTRLRETVFDLIADDQNIDKDRSPERAEQPSTPKHAGEGPRRQGLIGDKVVGVYPDRITLPEGEGTRVVYRDELGRFARLVEKPRGGSDE